METDILTLLPIIQNYQHKLLFQLVWTKFVGNWWHTCCCQNWHDWHWNLIWTKSVIDYWVWILWNWCSLGSPSIRISQTKYPRPYDIFKLFQKQNTWIPQDSFKICKKILLRASKTFSSKFFKNETSGTCMRSFQIV